MYKNLLVILSCLLVLFAITGCKSEKTQIDGFTKIYTIDSERSVYSKMNIIYTYDNGNEISLEKALKQNKITIDEMISKLEFVDATNDGGSLYFKYNANDKTFGNQDFYLAKCNSLPGNGNIKNIYIGLTKEEIFSICVVTIPQ